jgi:hypothetical protein
MRPRTLALLLCVAAVIALAAGCEGGALPTRPSAPPPPASASPGVVVTAWIDAVNAEDEAAGRVLSTPAFADADHAAADGWFANTLTIRDVHVGAPQPVHGLQSNRDHAHVVYVPVAFVLEQKKEVSFRDGANAWGFVLVRDHPGERWRISEQGLG